MKPFTIRKAAAPARGRPAGGETSNEAAKYATAPQGDRQNMSASGILDGEESAGHYPKQDVSNLSKEELEALQPKGLRVVNPWIHEQTHKQYLTNITVSSLPPTAQISQKDGQNQALTHPVWHLPWLDQVNSLSTKCARLTLAFKSSLPI